MKLEVQYIGGLAVPLHLAPQNIRPRPRHMDHPRTRVAPQNGRPRRQANPKRQQPAGIQGRITGHGKSMPPPPGRHKRHSQRPNPPHIYAVVNPPDICESKIYESPCPVLQAGFCISRPAPRWIRPLLLPRFFQPHNLEFIPQLTICMLLRPSNSRKISPVSRLSVPFPVAPVRTSRWPDGPAVWRYARNCQATIRSPAPKLRKEA